MGMVFLLRVSGPYADQTSAQIGQSKTGDGDDHSGDLSCVQRFVEQRDGGQDTDQRNQQGEGWHDGGGVFPNEAGPEAIGYEGGQDHHIGQGKKSGSFQLHHGVENHLRSFQDGWQSEHGKRNEERGPDQNFQRTGAFALFDVVLRNLAINHIRHAEAGGSQDHKEKRQQRQSPVALEHTAQIEDAEHWQEDSPDLDPSDFLMEQDRCQRQSKHDLSLNQYRSNAGRHPDLYGVEQEAKLSNAHKETIPEKVLPRQIGPFNPQAGRKEDQQKPNSDQK